MSGDHGVNGKHVQQNVVLEIRSITDKEETEQEQIKILLVKDSRKELELAQEMLFQRIKWYLLDGTILTSMHFFVETESLCEFFKNVLIYQF